MKQWYRTLLLMLLFALSLICHGQSLGVLSQPSHYEPAQTIGFTPITVKSQSGVCGGANTDFVIYHAPIR